MNVVFQITPPKPRELSFNPIEDVQHLIDTFIAGDRVFIEKNVRLISYEIKRLFDQYKMEANNEVEYRDACMLQHFIRVLNYGVPFKFVVMIKLSDQSVHKIYYE